MPRTTRNGDSLSAASLLAAAEETDFSHEAELREYGRDLAAFGVERKRAGFMNGMNLGHSVANRAAMAAVVTALLSVMGKDKGDGYIDLGSAGVWYPGNDDSFAVRKEA